MPLIEAHIHSVQQLAINAQDITLKYAVASFTVSALAPASSTSHLAQLYPNTIMRAPSTVISASDCFTVDIALSCFPSPYLLAMHAVVPTHSACAKTSTIILG